MQVELIGCTSAGKSTLIAAMMDVAREENLSVHLGHDVALGQFGLQSTRSRWLRALAVHAVAVVGCLLRGRGNLSFVRFSYQVLCKSEISIFQRVNQFRKVLKQLGCFEMIRRRNTKETIVLVDEGTVHAAHNLFVHVSCDLDPTDIHAFASQVPLPDVVIYVSEREDVLIERVIQRGHPRILHPTRPIVEKFVHHAVSTFDQLSQHERIGSRTAIIRNGQFDDGIDAQDPRMAQLQRLVDKASSQSRNTTNLVAPAVPKSLCVEMLS